MPINDHYKYTSFFLFAPRYGLARHEKCCYNYDVPEKYLKMIGTNESYVNISEENDLIEIDNIISLV